MHYYFHWIKEASAAASAIDLYSDSVDDLATVFCFPELQDIGLQPRKITWPAAQSDQKTHVMNVMKLLKI